MPKEKGTLGKNAFTIELPRALNVEKKGEHWWLHEGDVELRLSNLNKVFWPEEGYTKGDLLTYYYNVAHLIVPHLLDRPLTLKRMPNGITGDFFYEKERPSHVPSWVRTCNVSDINYLTVHDPMSLLFTVNLGAIEMHPLHSRCHAPALPDYLFFDLDPFEPATFDDVRAVALHVKAALDVLELPSFPKTSGATGMQIYVPINHGPTYQQIRDFVGAIGRMILKADPKRVTMEWQISKRTGKIFIDHNMNREGANIAAVYCVRPERSATVSTPVTWDEVAAGIHPTDFTIQNVHERFEKLGDLFSGVLQDPVDLLPALAKVGLPAEIDDVKETVPRATPHARRVTLEEGTPKDRRLAEYIKKRDFEATPEPAPGSVPTTSDQPIFVIHKHNATRLHYDLRLEHDGALESWAVPKGLPIAPGEKHLAVNTEPHPMEYATFSGWIPKGHYGAGESLIFDSGTYEPLEWEPDKLTIRLHGGRFTGEYHLVKTQQGWLIFLSRSEPGNVFETIPVFTPMLAESRDAAFDDDGWTFEPKMDGIRTIANVETSGTKLISRTGRDQTAIYPELNNLAMWTNAVQAVLDGEIVAADESGRPSFERLQSRMNLQNPRDIDRLRRKIPVTMFAFDLLWYDGKDLTKEPIERRFELLDRIITPSEKLRITLRVNGSGTQLFDAAKQLGFEGIVGKRLGSTYQPGRRSPNWQKIKAVRTIDCVILGWTPGEGSRASGFGALILGAFKNDSLRWIGQVGTGFTDAKIKSLLESLRAIEVAEPSINDPDIPKGVHWVRPELVCEVEYLEVTNAGKLRAPSFKGLRPDKTPNDATLPQ
ncbi:MAG: non-homologous end-joining DNA ligase [Actinomycetota bacterium]